MPPFIEGIAASTSLMILKAPKHIGFTKRRPGGSPLHATGRVRRWYDVGAISRRIALTALASAGCVSCMRFENPFGLPGHEWGWANLIIISHGVGFIVLFRRSFAGPWLGHIREQSALLASVLNPVRRADFGASVVELLREMRKFDSANAAAELWNRITAPA